MRDPAFADYTDHPQRPGDILREVRRFFEDYKILEHKQVGMCRRLRRGEITKS